MIHKLQDTDYTHFIFQLTLRILYFLLLILNAGICMFAAIRFRFFDSGNASLWAYTLLGIVVSSLIGMLCFMRSYSGRSIRGYENCMIYLPAVGLGLFVVLPGLKPIGILIYTTFFAASLCGGGLASRSLSLRQQENKESVFCDENEEEIEHETDENTFCRLIRSQTPDGKEQLETWVRVDFAFGERIVNVHIPFCPTFSKLPKIEPHQIHGDEVDINVAQLTPLGVRLDVKRSVQRRHEETVHLCVFGFVE